jgi:hypothetical protein
VRRREASWKQPLLILSKIIVYNNESTYRRRLRKGGLVGFTSRHGTRRSAGRLCRRIRGYSVSKDPLIGVSDTYECLQCPCLALALRKCVVVLSVSKELVKRRL